MNDTPTSHDRDNGVLQCSSVRELLVQYMTHELGTGRRLWKGKVCILNQSSSEHNNKKYPEKASHQHNPSTAPVMKLRPNRLPINASD